MAMSGIGVESAGSSQAGQRRARREHRAGVAPVTDPVTGNDRCSDADVQRQQCRQQHAQFHVFEPRQEPSHGWQY
jgi:hypothetical protein